MKILMLADSMDSGGVETHIFSLCSELSKRGHELCVASSGGSVAHKLERSGIRHEYLSLDKKSIGALISAYRGIRTLLLDEDFDLIHSHTRMSAFLVRLATRRLGIPTVSTVHASFDASGVKGRLSYWGERSIAVSEDLKQYLCESYSLPPENITVIPNGIDTEAFCLEGEKNTRLHKNERDVPRIAFLSRLDTDCSEGAELLIKIAPLLVEEGGRLEILIGGGGSEYLRIKAFAAQVNREIGFRCIKMLGSIRNVPRFMHSTDLFVGVSRAAMEACLCGLPVILCGNEGYMGLLGEASFDGARAVNFCARGYKKMSEERLLEDIKAALWEKRETVTCESERVRVRMARECSLSSCAEQTESFYRGVLSHRQKSGRGVLLCGYYGYGNLGDNALLRSAIERARREFGSLPIRALTKNGSADGKLFGVSCVKRSSPIVLFRELKGCRYFIFGGGTLLQNRTSNRSLLYYSALMRIAKHYGAVCLMWGNGIGEIKGRVWQKIAKNALASCDFVGIRDGGSLKRAEALLGETDRKIRLEGDLAEGMEACDEARTRFLLFSLFGSERIPSFVIVALNGQAYREGLAEPMLDVIKERGLCPVFVVMYEGEDGEVSERLCKRYGGKILKGVCFSDLVGLAARSKGVYSMRLHALIAAQKAGTPFYGIGNDEKITDFCKSCK